MLPINVVTPLNTRPGSLPSKKLDFFHASPGGVKSWKQGVPPVL
jgi:hypothetical protein